MIWSDYEILRDNDGWYWRMIWPAHAPYYGPFITKTEAVQDVHKHICACCYTLNPKDITVCVSCSTHFVPLRVPYSCPSREALEILLIEAEKEKHIK